MKRRNVGMIVALSLSLSLLFISGAVYAADSVSFNPVPVTIKAQPSGGVPVGTVVAWPVASQPTDAENWLDCDGRSTAGYPELAAVVGANVPNYQGLFLRGYGSQSHTQNNGSSVGNTSTLHQSGALGTIQGDATRNITGYLGTGNIPTQSLSHFQAGALYTNSSTLQLHPGQEGSGGSVLYNIGFDASRIVSTAIENRPVNKAVRYLIRARP